MGNEPSCNACECARGCENNTLSEIPSYQTNPESEQKLNAMFGQVRDDYAMIEQNAAQIRSRVAVFAKHGAVKFAEAEDNRMKQHIRNLVDKAFEPYKQDNAAHLTQAQAGSLAQTFDECWKAVNVKIYTLQLSIWNKQVLVLQLMGNNGPLFSLADWKEWQKTQEQELSSRLPPRDQTDESNDEPLEAGSLPVLKQMMQEKYFQKYRAEHKRITKLYQLMEWFHQFTLCIYAKRFSPPRQRLPASTA